MEDGLEIALENCGHSVWLTLLTQSSCRLALGETIHAGREPLNMRRKDSPSMD
jgi:hypothetical protein